VDELKASGKPFQIDKMEVWDAWLKVKGNQGAPGVDGQSVEAFEKDLKGNLYRIWNRMSSGTYFPPPVMAVEIPKPHGGGTRVLGVPTVADRIAQTVAEARLEAVVDPLFHPDSYGYRHGKSALDAVAACRRRCWARTWVIDLDIRKFLNPWSHCSFVHCGGQNSPSWAAGGSIRRPFLRPARTWTARSRPSLTRCMMVWRETP
jgi:RNA-directed DNA polymerase